MRATMSEAPNSIALSCNTTVPFFKVWISRRGWSTMLKHGSSALPPPCFDSLPARGPSARQQEEIGEELEVPMGRKLGKLREAE